MNAVGSATFFARNQTTTVLGTWNTQGFPMTAIVVAFFFGDAVLATTLLTAITIIHIHAVLTEPRIAGRAFPLATTIPTVTPVADAT